MHPQPTHTTLQYGSVRSGIEAVSLAWQPQDMQAAWFSEIDPFPCAVLAHHYPDVPNLGDMTQIATLVRDGQVVAPDILVGGTPCQSFSIAGARQGLSDPRGALTLKYVELANVIDQTRCHDNAVAESFFQLLKRERIKRKIYKTRELARQDIFDYIEMFYNPIRRHSHAANLSPVNYEQQYFSEATNCL